MVVMDSAVGGAAACAVVERLDIDLVSIGTELFSPHKKSPVPY